MISGDENISPSSFVMAKVLPVVKSTINTFPLTVQQQQIANCPCGKLRLPTKGQEPIAESSLSFQLKHISVDTLFKQQSWAPNRKRP